MDKYYAIESQKSDFCRVSDILLKQPIGVTLTVEQRNNLTAHIISSNTHYIGKLWSNAAILSSILYTTNETISSRLLPYPLDILLTQVATEDTSGNVYTYLLENPLLKNQTQTFPKVDYEKLRQSIQLLETVSIVSIKIARERFCDLLDIFHWYIMKHNMGSFYVDQTHNRIAIDITFMKTGKVREFLQLFQWCEEARRFLMRYFHEHKLNATLYKNSFKAELGIGDTVLNNKMQGIAENISKVASDAQLANDNNQNNRISTDTNNEIVDANNNNVNNSIETASHKKNGADSVIDSDRNIITQDDVSIHTDEELQANDNNQNSNDTSTDANFENVVLLGMTTADLVDIGYKFNRSQNSSELVNCVLKRVNSSSGGKKMETNLARDTLRVTMVMNHPSVSSVYTVSLANVSDVKYHKNHISCNFTDSRRFVRRLKEQGFGADGNKIGCLIMDYYWFQSVRMQ